MNESLFDAFLEAFEHYQTTKERGGNRQFGYRSSERALAIADAHRKLRQAFTDCITDVVVSLIRSKGSANAVECR